MHRGVHRYATRKCFAHGVFTVMRVTKCNSYGRITIDAATDPTSGSGSLLINIGQTTAKYMEDSNRIRYYAQELKSNTYNLTRMNLVMRGILPDNIVTRNGDTLEED